MLLNQNFLKKTLFTKEFFIICLTMLLSACVKSAPQIPDGEIQVHAKHALDSFVTSINNDIETKKHIEPYSLTGSIRFTSNDKSNRATYLIWSNGAHPVRFDLQAGIGSSVAKIMETEKEILFYFPLEEKAITTVPDSALNSLLSLDAPIPLTVLDLSYLCRGLLGSYLDPFIEAEINNLPLGDRIAKHLIFSKKLSKNGEYAFNWQKDISKDLNEALEGNYQDSIENNTEPTIENQEESHSEQIDREEIENTLEIREITFEDLFMATSPFFTTVILNDKGFPTEYIIQNDWHVFVQYIENKGTASLQVPYKITIKSLENDTNIVLLIKEHNNTASYTKEQLTLILPEKTTHETYNF